MPGGRVEPAGAGHNAAGLAIFRYRTRCGTVYGHTGNFPGYAQFAAATADGRRAVTTSLNIPAPHGRAARRLRAVQTRRSARCSHHERGQIEPLAGADPRAQSEADGCADGRLDEGGGHLLREEVNGLPA